MTKQILALSKRDLEVNKKRHRLTTLSIGISVFLVCVVLLISSGFYEQMVNEMNISDENVLTIAFGNSENSLNYTYLRLYSDEDVSLIQSTDGVQNATGIKALSVESVTYDNGKQLIASTIRGIDDNYISNLNLKFYKGGMPQNDNEALIGYSIYQASALDIGDSIVAYVNNEPIEFVVKGILEQQEEQSFSTLPSEINQMIAINNTSKYVESSKYIFVSAIAVDSNNLTQISENIIDQLNTDTSLIDSLDGTGLAPVVVTRQDVIEMLDRWFAYIDCFIVGLSLIIGFISAINIINIFAVTIQEKYKDIAVYKAVGASIGQIQFIFVFQSLLLGLKGSFFGIIAGIIVSEIAIYIMNWPMIFSVVRIIIPVIIGIGTSVVAGIIVSHRTEDINVSVLMNG